jgi:hypothetical protein
VRNNVIHLTPTPASPLGNPTMRVWYLRRPSELVLVSSVVTTTGFPAGAAAGQFRMSVTGSVPSSFIVGASVELVRATSGFEVDGPYPIAAVGSGYFDVTGTAPATAAVGDKLCLADTANVVTWVPQDFCWLLAQATAVEAIRSRGDDAKLARAEQGLTRLEAAAKVYLGQRAIAGNMKVVNGRTQLGRWRAPFNAG